MPVRAGEAGFCAGLAAEGGGLTVFSALSAVNRRNDRLIIGVKRHLRWTMRKRNTMWLIHCSMYALWVVTSTYIKFELLWQYVCSIVNVGVQ